MNFKYTLSKIHSLRLWIRVHSKKFHCLPAYTPFNEVILHYNYSSPREKILVISFSFFFFSKMKKKSEKIPQSNDEFLRHSMHRSQFASLIKKKEIRREKKKKKKIRIKAKQRRYRGSGGKKQSTLKGLNGAQRTHVTKVWHETAPIALPCKNNRGNRTNRFMNRVYAYETKPKQLLCCSQLYSIYIWKQVKKQYPTDQASMTTIDSARSEVEPKSRFFSFFYSVKREWFFFLIKFFAKIRMEQFSFFFLTKYHLNITWKKWRNKISYSNSCFFSGSAK